MKFALAKFQQLREMLDDRRLAAQSEESLSWTRKTLVILLLVWKSFIKNRGPVRASALAYTTLLALVPVLAVMVSITTSFLKSDGDKIIGELVQKGIDTLAPQLSLIPKGDAAELAGDRAVVVQKIMDFVGNIKSGAMGVTAGIMLAFIAVTVLSNIEEAFNDMWGVTRGRTWLARVVQYWAALTLGPMFVLTALGLTTGAQFQGTKTWIMENPLVGPLVLKLTPFAVLSVALMLFYRLMPNTKVNWDAALVGGITGGCLLQLNNLLSIIYVSRVVSYSKIYGGLGAVPIFLVGLYFSWMILLLGAQVAYAYQNRQAYLQERQAEAINQRGREFAALRIMTLISHEFLHGRRPPGRTHITATIGIPSQLANSLIVQMIQAKLIVEAVADEVGYIPARPLADITMQHVLDALRVGSGRDIVTSEDAVRDYLRAEYARVQGSSIDLGNQVTFDTLARKVDALQTEFRKKLVDRQKTPAQA